MNVMLRFIVLACISVGSVAVRADFLETTGEITLEAEDYQRNTPVGDEDWRARCTYSTAVPSGGIAMFGTGTFHGNNDLLNSPHLEFDISFTTNGTYAVWVKGVPGAIHVGLDGVRLESSVDTQSIDFDDTATDFHWSAWSNYANAGTPPEHTFVISDATPGGTVHTFDAWMRNPNVNFDKILITRLGTDPTVAEPTADDPAAGGGTLPTTAPPAINPDGGPIDPAGAVSLSTCAPGAELYYTLDTTDPTPDLSNPATIAYNDTPFTLPADGTEVRAVAHVTDGTRNDGLSSAVFVFDQFPVFNGPDIDPILATEGVAITPIDVSGLFSDPDLDPLTFRWDGLPTGSGLSIDPNSGIISGTPTSEDTLASPYSTRVAAIDPDLAEARSNLFDVTVTIPGQPLITSTPVTGATTDIAYTYNITSTDPDAGDSLVVTAPTLPAWLTFTDGGTGDGSALLTGTPTAANVGDHAVELVVTDDGVIPQSFTQSFSITVSEPTVASILPGSRSAVVNSPVTAFATMINAGSVALTGCGIAPIDSVPADFLYQTTDSTTNALIGTPNTPVGLGVGAAQSFVFAFTPTQAFAATDISFDFSCDDAGVATEIPGVNTFILSASASPVADIIALAASATPGQVVLSGGAGVFAVATANVGVAGTVQVSASTGGAVLPVTLSICQTDPVTSACTNPAVPTSTPFDVTIGAGETPTFGVFVSSATPIAFDPAVNRVFFEVRNQSGEVVASTSVAVSSP